MALDLDLLANEISSTEDFKYLYDELKRMTYFLYDYKIVNYFDTAATLDPKKNSDEDFLKKLLSEFQKNKIISEDKNEAIRLVNHFIFTIIAMGYIWDAVNEYKLQCNGDDLIFTKTPINENPPTIFYSYNHAQSAQIIVEINVKATKINGDKVTLSIKVCTPITSLTNSYYLNKIKISIFNASRLLSISNTFTLSSLNINKLQEQIEKTVNPK